MADFPASSEVQPLDIRRILDTLGRHGVEYVLIGGIATIVHGSAHVTVDADVVPATSPENLARLLDALRELGAAVLVSERRLRMESGEPWEIEQLRRGPEGFVEAPAWHFATDAGQIDVVLEAAAVGGYEAHLARAVHREVFGIDVLVAGIDDLIATKEHLGRPKDVAVIEDLREIRDGADPSGE